MLVSKINNYLKESSYKINLVPNKIYINNYEEINTINDNRISIKFQDFILNINGSNFKVLKMIDKEVLFNGLIESMEYLYR